MKNMTLQAIADACHGKIYYPEKGNVTDVTASRVVLDSRLVVEDSVFIATRGERVDGHSFIPQVFEKGALGVICEEVPDDPAGPCILVEDSFVALKDVARYYRNQLDLKIVGITGSVGKTSTKEFIATVLSKHYSTWKTQANFNNEVGMPLTILQATEEHEILVLEMGINHFGEMDRLSEIARPDVMVITNIGQCHLEYLGDRDGVLKAKTECFNHLNTDAVVILNGDDDKLATVRKVMGRKPLFFGRNKTNDYYAQSEKDEGLLGTDVALASALSDMSVVTHIPLPGAHMVYNALAAMAVGETLGLNSEEIAQGIADVSATSGRSNIVRGRNCIIIDDCYNANPVSMKAAIDLLGTAKGRKVAILGDMFELGEDENSLHKGVGEYAADKETDVIVCVGKLSRYMFDGAREADAKEAFHYEDIESLIAAIPDIVRDEDTVLVKASHSMQFSKIVDKLK